MAESVKAGEDPKVASDIIASEAYQRVKLTQGADGSATDVSTAAPLPVDDDATQVLLAAIKALLEGTGTVKVTDGGGSFGVDDNGGSLTVDGTVAVSALSGELPAGTKAIGTVVLGAGAAAAGKVIVSSLEGEPKVKVASLPETPAGTQAIGKLAANSGVDIGDVDVTSLTGGTVAHDGADSGNPIKTGARARTALPAAVAQDDRTDNVSDKFGRQLETTAPLDQRVSGSIDITGTETTDVIAAPGASIALVITDIEVVNGDATVGTWVEIFDDATKKWKGFAGALGGGFSQSNPDGLFVCTANKAVRAKCVTTSSESAVNISGYKIPA